MGIYSYFDGRFSTAGISIVQCGVTGLKTQYKIDDANELKKVKNFQVSTPDRY